MKPEKNDEINGIIQELEDYHATLKAFARHYLINEHPKSFIYRGAKFLLLATASISSAWLYITPSEDYGRRFNSESLGILEVIGNTAAAILVTANIALIYINHLEQRYDIKHSEVLKDFVEKTHEMKEAAENFFIIFGSLVSAGTLVAPSIQYSNNLPLWARILQASLIGFDYTLMHTLPMGLLFSTELRYFFGAPLYALYFAYEIPRRCLLSPKKVFKERLAVQTQADYLRLKIALINTLEEARSRLVLVNFKLQDKEIKTNWLALLGYCAALDKPVARNIPDWLDFIFSFFSGAVWGFGAFISPLTLAGFFMSNYVVAKAMTHSDIAGYFLAGAPSVITTILIGYFTAGLLQGIYDFGINVLRNAYELPLAVKLYPKTEALLLLMAGFLAYYSSGPAEELVYDNFSEETWGVIRDIFVACARYGVQGFCFANIVEIVFSMTLRYAKIFGNDEEKGAAILSERIEQLKTGIMSMDGKKLVESLKNSKQAHRDLLLGDEAPHFEQIINHKDNLKRAGKSILYPRDYFFANSDEEKPITMAVVEQEQASENLYTV